MDQIPSPVLRLAEERSWALLKEANAMNESADAMLFVSTTAIPLLVTGFKLAEAKGGMRLGRLWLERTMSSFASILEKETGDRFRVTIEHIEGSRPG